MAEPCWFRLTKLIAAPTIAMDRFPVRLGRSGFGLEIVAEIAYLVYIIGISSDKACQLRAFLIFSR